MKLLNVVSKRTLLGPGRATQLREQAGRPDRAPNRPSRALTLTKMEIGPGTRAGGPGPYPGTDGPNRFTAKTVCVLPKYLG